MNEVTFNGKFVFINYFLIQHDVNVGRFSIFVVANLTLRCCPLHMILLGLEMRKCVVLFRECKTQDAGAELFSKYRVESFPFSIIEMAVHHYSNLPMHVFHVVE